MELPDHKARPALVIQRDAAIAARDRVTVAPLTTRLRTLPTCLLLGADEGLDRECAANFDSLTVDRSMRSHVDWETSVDAIMNSVPH